MQGCIQGIETRLTAARQFNYKFVSKIQLQPKAEAELNDTILRIA